jgi:hypothetical protein
MVKFNGIKVEGRMDGSELLRMRWDAVKDEQSWNET